MSSSALSGDPSHHVAVGLTKIGLVLRNHAWEERGRTGLTPTQAQIVAMLGLCGPSSIGALAEALAVSQPTISDAVAALVAKSLVRKETGADRRVQLVALTTEGNRVAAAASEWPDALLDAVEALPPADQAAFLRGLSSMIRELQERGRIPVQRMCVTCRFFRRDVHADLATPHHCAFVNAPFGDRELRLHCADHEPATTKETA